MYEAKINKANHTIILGYQGENDARFAGYDVSDWQKTFGDGSVSLVVIRPTETVPYIAEVKVENGIAKWVVRDVDVEIPGQGLAEFSYSVNGTVVKDEVFKTSIRESIAQTPGPLDPPQQGIIDQMIALKEAAETAAKSANAAKADVKANADKAQTAASSAEKDALQVSKDKETAVASASSALDSANKAKASETASANSQKLAKDSETKSVASMNAAKVSETEAGKSAALSTSNLNATESAKDEAVKSKNVAAFSQEEARRYSVLASGYRDEAENSAATASGYRKEASAFADKAEINAGVSLRAADTATDKAQEAKQSETNAGITLQQVSALEGQAEQHKNDAAASATQAGIDAKAAATSASNAKASETAAGLSETNADKSAQNASSSETNAKTSEDNALSSQESASSSADKASQALGDLLAMKGTDFATLVGGKVPMSQLPATAIHDVFEVSSESELTGLNAQLNDVGEIIQLVDGVRTVVKSYQLLGDGNPKNRENWVVHGTSYAVQAGNASTATNAENANTINHHRLVQMELSQWPNAVKDPTAYYLIYDPDAEV